MKRATIISAVKHLTFVLLPLFIAGCALEKESGFNRAMQNLTAHYNIIFNANDLLRQKQDLYATAYIDDYSEILNVYQDAATQTVKTDKELDAVIIKANNVINIKEQSHYIGDAYLILGKANHLYGNYFNAVEFFNYTILSFPKRGDLKQEARVWQARSLMYLHKLPEARLVLDSAIKNINPKKSITADVYATQLQYHINTGNYTDAEDMAKKAIASAVLKNQRLRWTFILAQLQELNHQPKDAVANYTRIVKSNAPFEMAFNADLNRIRIDAAQQGQKLSRMDRLRKMLKDDKNKEFTDQIYYQIALLYLAVNDIDNAIKNLKLSVKNSLKNQNQKGLSYLMLADITFKNKADYVGAKKYYDSTLMNLSPNYPDYQLIQKKSDNLQVLASRLQIIGHEDTLQMLARLSDNDREAKINELVAIRILQQKTADANHIKPVNPLSNVQQGPSASAGGISTFYFYNVSTVSQGFSDFKRVWGNRKLEDNWRRAKRAAADLTANTAKALTDAATTDDSFQNKKDASAGNSYKQDLLRNIPLSKAQMDESNTRVYNAYLDIANFYRDVLDDKKEAIANFEVLLSRFPNDPNRAAIYYNLYRLYADIDKAKSDYYKNLILTNYADSIYAKVINDPEYSKRLDDKDAEFNLLYNQVYDLYAHKKYPEVMSRADELAKQYPGNKLLAQLAYLKAIAAGHQEKLEPFKADLKQIISSYPNDRLIVPLINQHLEYIATNEVLLEARPVVLVDNDINEAPFIPAAVVQPPRPSVIKPTAFNKPEPVKTVTAAPSKNEPVKTAQTVQAKPMADTPKPETKAPVTKDNLPANSQPDKLPVVVVAKPVPSIFSLKDSTNFYFVINVSTRTTNLSSSRFGIGQFNRANFQGGTIRHQLKDVGSDNQLIYVGRFTSLYTAKDYARAIIPLMPQIMKVPADKYSFFIITQENLDKLADKKTLDSYIDYYQQNYLK